MNNQPVATPSQDSEQDDDAARRAEADKALAHAYEAVADFIKELKDES